MVDLQHLLFGQGTVERMLRIQTADHWSMSMALLGRLKSLDSDPPVPITRTQHQQNNMCTAAPGILAVVKMLVDLASSFSSPSL